MKALVEAGVFELTPNGWTLPHRRQFDDADRAVRWMMKKSTSMQRERPPGGVRGNVVPVGCFRSLEAILAEYQTKWECERDGAVEPVPSDKSFTARQGQFLAFIYYFMKLNGHAPSERDMEGFFKISPASVHQMVLMLEDKKLIERTPGAARSIRLLVSKEHLPDLE